MGDANDDLPARLRDRLRAVLKDLAIAADTAELFLFRAGYHGEAQSLRGKVTAAKQILGNVR